MNAATTISETRDARLAELVDAAHREQIVADALDALVTLIGSSPVPVTHYEPIWAAVEMRLRRDATEAHRRSLQALCRLDDVRGAIEARERWVPTR